EAAIGADLHQPFDVLGTIAPQISLDLAVLDRLAQLHDLFLGEVLGRRVGVDAGLGEDLQGGRATDPEDVGEADFDPFVDRDVDPCDARHRSALPLLVSGVLADDQDRAIAADDLALLAHRLYGSSNLHRSGSRSKTGFPHAPGVGRQASTTGPWPTGKD